MNLGLRAAADYLGMSHVALLKAVKTGRVKRNADGTFDAEACKAALKQNTRPKKREKEERARNSKAEAPPNPDVPGTEAKPGAGPATPPPDSRRRSQPPPDGDSSDTDPESRSLAEATRQREWIRVEKERLNLERQRLSLVDLTAVNAFVAGMILKAREELTRLPIELRDQLAQETDPIECQKMLSDRIDQILEKMAEFKPITQ